MTDDELVAAILDEAFHAGTAMADFDYLETLTALLKERLRQCREDQFRLRGLEK